MKNILLVVVTIVFVGLGIFLITKNDAKIADQSGSQTTNTNSPSAEGVITYSDNGFGASTIKAMSGVAITVKNDSGQDLELTSNPHPVHTDNVELNQTIIGPGQSRQITLTKKGNWGYHNHLADRHTGKITVE